MTRLNQLVLVVTVAIGLALVTSSRPLAEDWGTITLTNTGVEPGASGQAALSNVGGYWDLRHGELPTYTVMSRTGGLSTNDTLAF